jgi:hypothetical protein
MPRSQVYEDFLAELSVVSANGDDRVRDLGNFFDQLERRADTDTDLLELNDRLLQIVSQKFAPKVRIGALGAVLIDFQHRLHGPTN